MTQDYTYGLLSAINAIIIFAFFSLNAIGDGYWVLLIGAPIASFFCSVLLWNIGMKKLKLNTTSKIAIIGTITGLLIPYVTLIITNIGMNICYLTTENCTGSLNQPPASIFETILFGYGYAGWFLILYYGWVLIPASVGVGFLTTYINKKS